MPTPNQKEWYEKELDALIRDATKVGSIPKSELRQRFTAILAEERRRTVEELEKALVAQTIGESIEHIREARIAVRKKYPHLFPSDGNPSIPDPGEEITHLTPSNDYEAKS